MQPQLPNQHNHKLFEQVLRGKINSEFPSFQPSALHGLTTNYSSYTRGSSRQQSFPCNVFYHNCPFPLPAFTLSWSQFCSLKHLFKPIGCFFFFFKRNVLESMNWEWWSLISSAPCEHLLQCKCKRFESMDWICLPRAALHEGLCLGRNTQPELRATGTQHTLCSLQSWGQGLQQLLSGLPQPTLLWGNSSSATHCPLLAFKWDRGENQKTKQNSWVEKKKYLPMQKRKKKKRIAVQIIIHTHKWCTGNCSPPADAVPKLLLRPTHHCFQVFIHMMPCGVGGPFGHFGSPAPVLSPPLSLCPPAPCW